MVYKKKSLSSGNHTEDWTFFVTPCTRIIFGIFLSPPFLFTFSHWSLIFLKPFFHKATFLQQKLDFRPDWDAVIEQTMLNRLREFSILEDSKSHHWLKSYDGFTGPDKQAVSPRQKCLLWRTSLWCTMVELHRGGCATNGAILSSFPTLKGKRKIQYTFNGSLF